MQLKKIIIIFAVFTPMTAIANVVGNDFQNFNPTYSGLDFISVHSSETLDPCILNFGLFYNQAYNSLPFFESIDVDDLRNRSNYSDVVGGLDFNIGYGLSRNWDFGVNIQSVVHQDVKSSELISGSFKEKGLSEVRLNTKYRFSGDARGGLAMILSANFNMVENNIFTGEDSGPTFNFELAYDKTFGRTNWGLNVGHRWRDPGRQIESGIPPMKNSMIYSTALSYLFENLDTKLVWELLGSFPTQDVENISKKARSNLETLLALKYDSSSRVSWVGGLGTEVQSGTATPDWRFFVGLNYGIECCDRSPDRPRPEPQPITEHSHYHEHSHNHTHGEDHDHDDEFGHQRRHRHERIHGHLHTHGHTHTHSHGPEGYDHGGDSHYHSDIEQPIHEYGYTHNHGPDHGPIFEPEPLDAPEVDPPTPVPAATVETPDEFFILRNINFKTDSHTKVYGKTKTYLRKLAGYLKKKGLRKLIVVGHTDSIGKASYNLQLSRRRARAIARYMVKQFDIDARIVHIKYFGESRPIADNGNYQGRRQNRRVEFAVYYKKKGP